MGMHAGLNDDEDDEDDDDGGSGSEGESDEDGDSRADDDDRDSEMGGDEEEEGHDHVDDDSGGEDEDDEDEEEAEGGVMHGDLEDEFEDLMDAQRLMSDFSEENEHDMMLNNEHDIDDLMQHVLENVRGDAREAAGDMQVSRLADDGQVLSLLVPSGGRGPTALLQELLQDMQVLRFPGRGGRSGGGDARSLPRMLHEVPAADHPLLSRRQDPSSRVSRAAYAPASTPSETSSASAAGANLPELEDLLEGANSYIVDREGGGGGSRWTDDGAGLSAGMRGLALELEESLAASLQEQAPPRADDAAAAPAPDAPSDQSASAAAVAPSTSQGTAPAAPTPATAPAAASGADPFISQAPAPAAAAAASISGAGAGGAPDTAPAGTSSAGGDEASAGGDVKMGSSQGEAPQQEQQQQAAKPSAEGQGEGAMEEDEDDEFEAALRLSMASAAAPDSSAPPAQPAPPAPEAGQQSVAPAPAAAGAGAAEAAPVAPSGGAGAGAGVVEGGIDPSFLAELPEELRAEVMAAQQQQEAAARLAANASTAIDPEFLAALPPDIQADVLLQHQRSQEPAAEPAADVNGSQDMDNASFIATLSPELQEEVLLSADDAFLASLPPHLSAEAALLRERAGDYAWNRYDSQIADRSAHRPPPVRRTGIGSNGSKVPGASLITKAPKQVIQEEWVASIVRLVFLSSAVNKSLMHRMLSHLCAHAPTRVRAVRMLLGAVVNLEDASEAAAILGPDAAAEGALSPATVSKRALEALSHVATGRPSVCELLLEPGFLDEPLTSDAGGKRAVGSAAAAAKAGARSPFDALVRQLATPLYLRSASHLEQLALVLCSAVRSHSSIPPDLIPIGGFALHPQSASEVAPYAAAEAGSLLGAPAAAASSSAAA
eukprot:CAMPEP_0169482690 /NCGR_PEP_ID=MMETSP1042-20121227/30823_1 /TAXON_ID=464988 /ORGANISM="Hemiselmis andersenii, Strain CCMP1180" /LENGTH=887 /DNA_ID=CAMNT_0009597601 /DNA_START=1 /DNA_END=2662 /DNA_ORIENTATION=+